MLSCLLGKKPLVAVVVDMAAAEEILLLILDLEVLQATITTLQVVNINIVGIVHMVRIIVHMHSRAIILIENDNMAAAGVLVRVEVAISGIIGDYLIRFK
jgi:hypothetical protein